MTFQPFIVRVVAIWMVNERTGGSWVAYEGSARRMVVAEPFRASERREVDVGPTVLSMGTTDYLCLETVDEIGNLVDARSTG